MGLEFLEKVNLMPHLKKQNFHSIVLHGKDDRVVPFEAGEALAKAIAAEFVPMSGGHSFFLDQSAELRRLIQMEIKMRKIKTSWN